MKLTKRHAIAGILLGAAVAAVLVDRLVLDGGGGEPAHAAADAHVPGASLETPRERHAPPVPDPPAERSALAGRLDALGRRLNGAATSMRDAFQLIEPWRSELLAAPDEPPEGSSARPDVVFVKAHRLTSVLVAGPRGMVVVDGKTVRIGEQFDGARLLRVMSDKAVFELQDRRIELKLTPVTSP